MSVRWCSLSAGVGVTPVLAMLHALADCRSDREIWWVHTTRDAHTHAFMQEVSDLVAELPHAQQHVFYSSTVGRLDHRSIAALGLPQDATVYMCGPDQFMADMRNRLTEHRDRVRRRSTPNCSGRCLRSIPASSTSRRARRILPSGPVGTGPPVSFSRSGLTVNWSSDYGSILELAEACDVPTRFSCRSGVCHTCVTQLIAGTTAYTQPPLELPADGTVLICIAEPSESIVLDL